MTTDTGESVAYVVGQDTQVDEEIAIIDSDWSSVNQNTESVDVNRRDNGYRKA